VDRLAALINHTQALEEQLGSATGNAYAALSARYMDALRQIEDIERRQPASKSPVDEIAQRRARRKPVKDGVAREV
jgi:DNA anti-recombination protein RmuC